MNPLQNKLIPYITRLGLTPAELAEHIAKVKNEKAYLEAELQQILYELEIFNLTESAARTALLKLLEPTNSVTDTVTITVPVTDTVTITVPVSEVQVPIRKTVLFDNTYRSGASSYGQATPGTFDGQEVVIVSPKQWASSGVFWNGTGVQNWIKTLFFKPAKVTSGYLTIRHAANWATVPLDATNRDKWLVNGLAGKDIPTDTWVELAINLTALGITEFKALCYDRRESLDLTPVYFANIGFDPELANTFGPAPVTPITPVAPPPITNVVLTKFSPTPVALYNYNDIYHPLTGPQPGKQPDGWVFAFENNVPNVAGELVHKLTNFKASGIKWEAEKKLKKTQGHYITEATLPNLRNGVISNPLWLYSEGAAEGGHEYDFELMNGRIEYNLHNGNGGFTMKKTEKDLSGHRVRFEIIRRPGIVTMRITSLTDGFTDQLIITPEIVKNWATKTGAPVNLRFPPDNIAMFPLTEHWISRWDSWSGTWIPLSGTQSIDMILHGYSFLP